VHISILESISKPTGIGYQWSFVASILHALACAQEEGFTGEY